jgi:hypothetical protein
MSKKKLQPNHFAQFTLSCGTKTSGLIMSIADGSVSYHDEETRLLCSVLESDIIKVQSCEPATKAQAALATPRVPTQVPGQEIARGHRSPKKEVVVVPIPSGRKPRAAGGPTKLDQAVALRKANPGLGRDQVVELFMKQLNMSKAGATTYFYTSSKATN